ncbi:MAG: hypothetical protein WAK93_19510 [Solirubrobacteraceae bacterium]
MLRSSRRAGWLGRAPWVWGEGSVAWLTAAGIEAAGLGGVRAVKAPPSPTTIAHAVLVGWSAARVQRRGRTWKAARELALDPDRWAAPMRCERGYTHQLPDLAVWLNDSEPPGAVIAESGGRREDRQKLILEGWRDALWSRRYIAVRYDCTSPSVAHWINRLAGKVGLTDSAFMATVQTTPEEIAALSPTLIDDEPALDEPESATESVPTPDQETQIALVPAQTPRKPVQPAPREPQPVADLETPKAAAERERAYREIFGIEDPKPRRRWRR